MPAKKTVKKKRQAKPEVVVVATPDRHKPKRPRAKKPRSNGLFSTAGEVAGGVLASALGGPWMAPLGSAAGGALGSLLSHITGFGDYKINENSLMDGGLTPPQVINSMNDGGFIVRHREYIGEVTSHTAFDVSRYNINPGLETTFPWLSAIAPAFEQYRFRGLLFEFNSTSSDAVLSTATSSSLGTISMATEYDVLEPDFPDKRAMLNHEFSNSRKPSVCFIHPVECASNQTPVTKLYVRTEMEPLPADADLRLYDWGAFQIASEGQQADGGVLGELWATYEVEFYKSKYHGSSNFGKNNIEGFLIHQADGAYLTGAARLPAISNMHGVITGDTTYHVPRAVVGDVYFFMLQCASTSGTSAYPGVNLTNMTGFTVFINPPSTQTATYTDGTGASTTSWSGCTCARVTATNCSIGFSGGSSGADGIGTFWAIRLGQAFDQVSGTNKSTDKLVELFETLSQLINTKTEPTEDDKITVSQILGSIPKEDLINFAKNTSRQKQPEPVVVKKSWI